MFLDACSVAFETYDTYPFPEAKIARMNLGAAIAHVTKKARAEGKDPTSYPVVVDTCSTKPQICYNYAPCLTKARGGALGFWTLQHGRPLNVRELCRLQGLDIERLKVTVTDHQLGGLLGNGFTVTVIQRVILNALLVAEVSTWKPATGGTSGRSSGAATDGEPATGGTSGASSASTSSASSEVGAFLRGWGE